MLKRNASRVVLAAALAIAACQTSARQELHRFAIDLEQKAADVRREGTPGIYTLDVSGGPSEIAVLPAHGSATTFGLSAELTRELDQRAAASDDIHVFLIRGHRIVAEERLGPGLAVSPTFAQTRYIQFHIARSKQSPDIVDITLLNPEGRSGAQR